MPSTASDILVSFVFYSGITILAVSFMMMVFVLFFRIWSLGKSRAIRRFNQRWETVLEALGHTIPSRLPPIRPKEAFLFLKLWSDYYEKADPTGRENLLELASHLRLESIAAKMLEERGGDHKILAMRTMGHLKSESATDKLLEMLKHPNPLFSLLAARALIRISGASALDLLMPYFIAKKEWQTNKVLLILGGIDPDTIAPVLIDAAGYTPVAQLPRLIRFFTLMPPERAREKAHELLKHHSDPEIIAACLHYTNHPEDKMLLKSYLAHKAWVVRMHTVKALAPILTVEEVGEILPLLRDHAWWVRYHTARTVVEQPFADTAYLDAMDASLSDPYAKDALRQARSKRSIFEHL